MTILNASNVALNTELQEKKTTLNARNVALNTELEENGGSEWQADLWL